MITNAVAPDKLGGLERYVRELSANLVERNLRVTVISKQVDSSQPLSTIGEDGVEVRRYMPPKKSDRFFALKYEHVIRAQVDRIIHDISFRAKDPVILHGHFPAPMHGIVKNRLPFIYTFHAPVYKEIASERQGSYFLPPAIESIAVRGMRLAEKRVLNRANKVFTLSQFTLDEASVLDSAVSDRHILVPGGIDTGVFNPGERDSGRSDKLKEGPVLFAARRLVERTGIEQLVEAMPAVVSEFPAARLVISGDGPRRESIENVVAQRMLTGNVTLVGRVPEEELVGWYRSADLAITPTQDLEGFGLSTAEALACGTPALVTPVGANEEVVRDLDKSLITKSKGPSGIAESIIELLRDKEKLSSIALKCSSFATSRYGWGAVSERYIRAYQEECERTMGA